MSGGRFDYRNDQLCNEIFDYTVYPEYGAAGFKQSRVARTMNPLEDKIISELVFDVFCLLHSFDYYKSGDTGEETYQEDVKRFKEKWLKPMRGKRAREIVDQEIEELRKELYKAFGEV